jgi:hypothetical protein
MQGPKKLQLPPLSMLTKQIEWKEPFPPLGDRNGGTKGSAED